MSSNIEEIVLHRVRQYFEDLGDQTPFNLYDMTMMQVEKPLLEEVMRKAGGNQLRAAAWLGLNRSTLRKKLQKHLISTSCGE